MKKSHIIGGIIAIILIVLVIIGLAPKKSVAPGADMSGTSGTPILVEKEGLKTYTQRAFGFSVQFPSDWTLEDHLSGSTCCLFIAHVVTSTSTQMVATGTPATTTPRQTVTQKELIKLQIGAYDRKISDPFSSSTAQTLINGKTFYTGYMSAGEYFLLPRDQQTGIGIAEFRYIETPQADIDAVRKIIGSITFVGTPTATIQPSATSTKSTNATSTKASTATLKK